MIPAGRFFFVAAFSAFSSSRVSIDRLAHAPRDERDLLIRDVDVRDD